MGFWEIWFAFEQERWKGRCAIASCAGSTSAGQNCAISLENKLKHLKEMINLFMDHRCFVPVYLPKYKRIITQFGQK